MAEDYEREKLANAVGALATAAPIQRRLQNAYLAMHTMNTHGFVDPERQAEYDEIHALLTADKTSRGDGYVEATTSRLSDEEAEAIAQKIVNLNTALNWHRVWQLQDEIRSLKANR